MDIITEASWCYCTFQNNQATFDTFFLETIPVNTVGHDQEILEDQHKKNGTSQNNTSDVNYTLYTGDFSRPE
jgi:hypothetical protein